MIGSRRRLKVAAMIALVGLGACLAGCVSDLGATATDAPGTHQMRYYGGPKDPMWPSQ